MSFTNFMKHDTGEVLPSVEDLNGRWVRLTDGAVLVWTDGEVSGTLGNHVIRVIWEGNKRFYCVD